MGATLEAAKAVAEIAEKALAGAGIIVGGFWAYYKYIRGRTFRHRLELSISGAYVPEGSSVVLTIELKNIGASDIPFRQEGTGATVEQLMPGNAGNAAWSQANIVVVTVLKDHDWIEPAETIREQHLVYLPDPEPKALRLRLRIVSGGKSYSKRVAWVCTSIATPQPKSAEGDMEVSSDSNTLKKQKSDNLEETAAIESLKNKQEKQEKQEKQGSSDDNKKR